ncbi:hypothetical protein MNV_80049 [Candidatus Methanoperedens nitroreducens]|uniref:Uncharacterized protein n=1 Tax=Candidatus Methanoperedens nitratireducens TaxID=1392998 RepID=A0A284VTY4_9EURY|nr:hypothetical protein MNV_80049 [Candidatus Methanoperedens nitroreducens]
MVKHYLNIYKTTAIGAKNSKAISKAMEFHIGIRDTATVVAKVMPIEAFMAHTVRTLWSLVILPFWMFPFIQIL